MKKREADKVKAEKQDWWEWQEMDHSIQDSIQEKRLTREEQEESSNDNED